MFGFLNIYKPEGMTSFDVVAVLRRITKIKQIGHTGTLDPMATGVLPICIGKATKLIEYLPNDKEYTATIQFGSDTDTYDKEGQITKIYNNKISKEQLIEVLKNFEGEIEQFPPIYSAIKVNGKKLYDYARKGETVEITPRKVFISKIQLDNFDEQNQQAQIKVACSKGTYIRSIAYDIGQKLNCGGHLIALERTKAGMFEVDTSINLENIKAIEDIELVNPLDVLPQPKYTLNEQEKEHIIHGMPIKNRFKNCEKVVFLVYGDKMYGIGYCEKDIIKVKKVFETE